MKRIVLLVALALACSAWAQPAQKEAPKPQAATDAPEAAKVAPKAAKTAKARAKAGPQKTAIAKKSRRSEDARHCLQRTNNTEIIKCAEEFL